jgi:hypothetical protein
LKPLSGLDSLFLHLETPATPMHVGAVHLLQRPRRGGDFLLRVRRHVARRLHLSPVFAQLASMPLDSPTRCGSARPMDLSKHIVRSRPVPGRSRNPEAAIARLHASHSIDRGHCGGSM